MKNVYIVTILVMVVAMLVLGLRARRKNTDLARSLLRLTICVAAAVFTSLLAMTLHSDRAAVFMQTVHYVTTEWTLIFLMAFLERYTGRYEGTFATRMTVFILSGLSSVNLLLNDVFGHVVYCENTVVDGVSYRMFVNLSPGYSIHMILSYSIAICCMLTLIMKAIKTIHFYRVRYVPAIIAFGLTVAIEAICAIEETKLDYALFGYIWLGMFLIYYSLYHEYKGLITSTMSYITSDSHNGVICYNIEGDCIYVNEIIWKFYPEKKEVSEFDDMIRHYIKDEDPSTAVGQKWTLERGSDENKRYYDIRLGRISDDREDCIGYYLHMHDKTDEVNAYETAQYEATHDVLTGLYNVPEFNRLVKARMRAHKERAYLLAADIKDFKLINDLFGYVKGDEILKKFAIAMGETLSRDSICCRVNSDRFEIYIPKKDFSEESILEGIKDLALAVSDDDFQLVFHFGVFEIEDGIDNVAVMYDCARIALRTIKNDYNRFFSYYDNSMMNRLIREKEIVSEFDKAVEEKQFKMFLQPQIIPTGETVGAEALVRWIHPDEGMVSPGEFIPTFEKAGMIHKLDQYMWEEAAAKIKEWQDSGNDKMYISVNISPADFRYLDIYETFVGIVEKYGIAPAKLKLEITESVLMRDPQKQLAIIERLQQYGFDVEIDDFGSGYSSFNMLKDMKANVLKIDMGFLRKTSDTARAETIVDMIINLAKKLQMVVICEGVETEEQVGFLKEAGCDVFQGYFFDKPIPVDDFEQKYMK